MQEFFHNFVVNFFLFVTALKFAVFCFRSDKCLETRKTLTFSAIRGCFRRFGGGQGREEIVTAPRLSSPSVLTMTAAGSALFPQILKNFYFCAAA